LIELAERFVARAFPVRLFSETPVDLYRLAASRRIHTIEFRPLLADGSLNVTDRGFLVQINDADKIVISVGSTSRDLSTKQRFTLAHEIAHTLTYDHQKKPPMEQTELIELIDDAGGRSGLRNLEDFCQVAAGMILVPTFLLSRMFGQFGMIDSLDDVLGLARRLQVSPEVLMHRVVQIERSERLWPSYYALLFIAVDPDEKVRACFFSHELRSILDPPKLYSRLATWLKRVHVSTAILSSEAGAIRTRVGSGFLHLSKTPYGSRSYFLEIRLEPT
jgi:hypothetical protein